MCQKYRPVETFSRPFERDQPRTTQMRTNPFFASGFSLPHLQSLLGASSDLASSEAKALSGCSPQP